MQYHVRSITLDPINAKEGMHYSVYLIITILYGHTIHTCSYIHQQLA